MTRYIWCGRTYVSADEYKRPPVKRSALPCPYIRADLPAYRSPLSSKVIEGRSARREEMKRYDVREVEPSERPEGAGIPKTKAQAAAERKQLADRPKYAMTPETKKRLMEGA